MKKPRPEPVRLQNLAQAYGQSAALTAAVELDLFTAVDAGAGTINEIAEAPDLHPTNAERLVTTCTAMGLLHRLDGRYANAGFRTVTVNEFIKGSLSRIMGTKAG